MHNVYTNLAQKPSNIKFTQVKFNNLQPELLHMSSSRIDNQNFYTSQSQEPITNPLLNLACKLLSPLKNNSKRGSSSWIQQIKAHHRFQKKSHKGFNAFQNYRNSREKSNSKSKRVFLFRNSVVNEMSGSLIYVGKVLDKKRK